MPQTGGSTVRKYLFGSLEVDDKYRAVDYEKWCRANPNKDPEQMGYLVRAVPIEGIGPVKCALMRHLNDGEWDVNMKSSMKTQLTETVGDGCLNLRANQQEDRFRAITSNSIGTMLPAKGQVVRCMPSQLQVPIVAAETVSHSAVRLCWGEGIDSSFLAVSDSSNQLGLLVRHVCCMA